MMMNDLKKKLNLIQLVNLLKRRPGIYFGTAKIESLCAVGHFIHGYLTSGAATGQRDEFDTYFSSYFSGFVREQLDVELDHYEFWPETIEKNTSDMDAAVEKFFELFDAFCELLDSKELTVQPQKK